MITEEQKTAKVNGVHSDWQKYQCTSQTNIGTNTKKLLLTYKTRRKTKRQKLPCYAKERDYN